MRVAVFDLDGTLADTSADLIAAANGALAEAGIGAPPRSARATARSPSPAAGRCCGPDSSRLGASRRGRGRPALSAAPRALRARARRPHPALRRRRGGARPAGGGRLEARGLHQQARAARGAAARSAWGSTAASRCCSAPTALPSASPTRGTCSRRSPAPAACRSARCWSATPSPTATRRGRPACPACWSASARRAPASPRLGPEALIAHFDELPPVLERLVPA